MCHTQARFYVITLSDSKDDPPAALTTLDDSALEVVVGGINPQPLPPFHEERA
jgi:hypothetical protein